MLCLYVFMAHVKHKSKKNKNKAKLNLTVREEQRNKLEQMASLENRSVSNLIEVMADERWKGLAEGAPPGKLSEAQKQELAETILEAHKALIKAARKNIPDLENVVDSLEQELQATAVDGTMMKRDPITAQDQQIKGNQ